MDERTRDIIMNNAAIHTTTQRAFLTVMLAGVEVTEEAVWQVAKSLLHRPDAAFVSAIRASIQDVLTSAEMLRGGRQ